MTILSGIARTKIIWIGHEQLAPDWRRPLHAHSFYELIVMVRGKLRVEIAGRTLRATTGDILFYPPDQGHDERSADAREPIEKYYLGWAGPAYAVPLATHDRDGRVRMLIQWLSEAWSAHGNRRSDVILSLFAATIAEVVRLASQREDTFVKKIRRFVAANIERKFRVDELARLVNMSRYHFIRQYKAVSGRTPMADVRLLRIEAAKRLIITTDMPLGAVAERVGISDEYHLSKMFRKYLDLPPGYFRRHES